MKHTAWIFAALLLCSPVLAGISNVDKIKWDWVAISPNHLEFDKPECKHISVQSTFRVTNATEINLEIFSKEYPNGISTGHIFNLYGEHAIIHAEEIKTILVCAEYEPGSVPRGTYEATLVIESIDRVYQIPLTLEISFWNRFWQKTEYEFRKMWFKELFVIPTPDGTYLAFLGYHFLSVLLFILVFIWAMYLIYRKKTK